MSYAVQADMQGSDVMGTLSGDGMRSYFEAHREGAQLHVIMADIGADGKPDYAKAREVVFSASTAGGGSDAVTAPVVSAGSPAPTATENPLAGGGSAARFTGTFTSADVTLTLKKDGTAYSGTIRYHGDEYPATARGTGETLTGTFKSGATSYDMSIASAGDGKFVNLSTGGTTFMLARAGASAAASANPLAGGPTSTSTNPGKSAQDQQLARVLTANAWCSFSYSGSSTYTGGSGGTTRTSRAVFRPDGTVSEGSNSETVNTGAPGSVYGNNSGGQQAKWKIENGQLMLSADGVQWVVQPLKVENNSNGYPIVTSGGKEYMICK